MIHWLGEPFRGRRPSPTRISFEHAASDTPASSWQESDTSSCILSLLLERFGLRNDLSAGVLTHLPAPWRDTLYHLASFTTSEPGPRLAMPVVLRIR